MSTEDVQKSKVLKAATWYTISNIVLRGISLFTAPVFTRMLSTSDYGIASNFVSWSNILFCITSLGLATSVVRGKLEFKEDFKQYLSSIQFLRILATIAVFVICLPTLSFWSQFMELDPWLVIMMLLYLVVFPSVGYMQTNYRFEYKYKENIMIAIVNTLGNVACSIGLILIFSSQRYAGRILGTIIPLMIFGLFYSIKIFLEGKTYINISYWKYALKISLPMIPHSLAMIVLAQIDRIMIMKLCGSREVGIYSFGYSYGILLSVVTNAINEAVQPTIFNNIENKDYSRMNGMLGNVYKIIAVLAVGIIAVGPEALSILGPKDYYEARWIIFSISLGTLFQFFYQTFTCAEIYHKNTKLIAVGSVLAALLNALLNWIFIPRFGYIAAGYTTMVGYFVLMVYHYWGAYYVSKEKTFRVRPIAFYILLSLLAGTLFMLLYDNILIRYIVLCLGLLGIAIFERENIKMLLNKYFFKNKA